MSKSTISRDEKRRQVEAKEGGEGVLGSGGAGEQGSAGALVRVTTWAGRANYECGLCAYATLDVEGMAGHLRAVHGWRESALSLTLSQGEREPEVVASAAVAGEDEDEDDQDEVM